MHFTAPVVAALAAFAATADAKRYTCDRKNYAIVAHEILNPAYFCKFYLKEERLYSPLKQFGPKQLTNLCHCFVQNSPHVRGPIKSVPIPHANYDVCNQKHVNAIRNQYRQPVRFSQFWVKSSNRKYSPMPTIPNVKAVHKAAQCVIAQANNNPPPASSSSPSAASTPATTPSSAPASSAPSGTGSSSAPATSAPAVAATTTTGVIAPPAITTSTIAPRATTTGTTSTVALPCVLGIGPGCPAPSSFSTSTTSTTASNPAITSAPSSAPTTSTTTTSSSTSSA